MQPTIIEDTISIAAGQTNENVIVSNASLRGLLNTPYPCKIKVLAVTSGAGLRIDFTHGSKKAIDNSDPRIATFPEDPLDLINSDVYAQAQEQIVLRCNNSTAGPLSLSYRIMLTPVVDDSWDGNMVDLPPDCVVMQRLQSIAAAAVDVQLLDGLTFQQLAVPGYLRVLMTGSAPGLLRQLFIDQDRIAPPSVVAASNRMPQDPFDSTIDGVEVPANAQQFLSVSNPTAGALTIRWKTKFQKLVRE